jgi:sugar lactone lactonase YvrE
LWHARRSSYFWTDADNNLYEKSLGNDKLNTWKPGMQISLLLEDKSGDVILGSSQHMVRFDLINGSLSPATVQIPEGGYQYNMAACDCSGRVWAGHVPLDRNAYGASLYCLGQNARPRKMIGGLTDPVGIAWSVENERMYFVDRQCGSVVSYFFQKSSGDISFERVVIKLPDDLGIPSGMTIDKEGLLWIALSGTGLVGRWDPRNGKLIETVSIPVPNITGCVFAGPNLGSLAITTTHKNLTDVQLEKYPASGSIFVVEDTGTGGMAPNKASIL